MNEIDYIKAWLNWKYVHIPLYTRIYSSYAQRKKRLRIQNKPPSTTQPNFLPLYYYDHGIKCTLFVKPGEVLLESINRAAQRSPRPMPLLYANTMFINYLPKMS